MNVDFIVKLGGSAITDKCSLETLNEVMLELAADVLAKCHSDGLRFIVLHGAGSFGHHQAKDYGVSHGFNCFCHAEEERKARVKLGFSVTRQSVTKLNTFVVDALVKRGIPAVTLSACGPWRTNGGRSGTVSAEGVDAVKRFLLHGFVPVLHGDCVLDDLNGCAILSGDTILQVLCDQMRPHRAIFLMNCAGCYTLPPQQPDAALISVIRIDHDGRMINGPASTEISSCGPDVTGGISLKLNTAAKITLNTEGRTAVLMCGGDTNAFSNACHCGDFLDCNGTKFVWCEEKDRDKKT